MERRSFHDEIGRNRQSSILLIIVLTLIMVVLAASIAYAFAPEYLIIVLPFSLIFMLAYSYGSYMYGDQVVLSATL